MKNLELPHNAEKRVVFETVAEYLGSLGLGVSDADLERPWGGFYVIDDASTPHFIDAFFPGYSRDALANGLPLTPKILIVAPEQRLSWQYHHRREEIWSVVAGPVGMITSPTDEQGPLETLQVGDVVSHGVEIRHRLCGLHAFGVVAEFWRHTDPANPSNEADIVRVADDYTRAA